MIPDLEQRLLDSSEEQVIVIADLVCVIPSSNHSCPTLLCWQIQKGASSARADDTKTLKSAILNWITPRGELLIPLLDRKVKSGRGFHHDRTGALLCPAGLDWSNHE
jgi:hypothetical protein